MWSGLRFPESCRSWTTAVELMQRSFPRDPIDAKLQRQRIGDHDLGIGDGDPQFAGLDTLLQDEREQLAGDAGHVLIHHRVEGVVVGVVKNGAVHAASMNSCSLFLHAMVYGKPVRAD